MFAHGALEVSLPPYELGMPGEIKPLDLSLCGCESPISCQKFSGSWTGDAANFYLLRFFILTKAFRFEPLSS